MFTQARLAPCTVDAMNYSAPPLDYSFRSLTAFSDALEEEPRPCLRSILREGGDKKYKTNAVRLNNNALSNYNDFQETLEALLVNPSHLSWLDLSFNNLTTIDKGILQFSELKVFNLHGNGIEKLTDIDKLASLQKLRSLTVHGNPVEDSKGYRQYIISKIPQLEKLDFSKITKADRETAKTLLKFCSKNKNIA
ncbi:leucine-rich repeat-containing protein 51-like [Xenia sp. Carnegie-2017]|uniref:leucine-rich repeat-containing protein 51-like n=1 Tax=Xenia sp. Carnegie-2017 TaxID=2897299 RepID=UPI001F033E5D|nr:leucine-rich repeat-containing protein 51-like [Xenia sp. Carnegie-2017]